MGENGAEGKVCRVLQTIQRTLNLERDPRKILHFKPLR